MLLKFFIPFKKKEYLLHISERIFLQKLEEAEKRLEKEYQPGKYYLIHEEKEKIFIFKNRKFQTSKESGVISKFRYSFRDDKTIIKSTFRYSSIFYFFLPLILLFLPVMFYKIAALGFFAPVAAYIIFCFPLHLEAWVVTEEFKTLFKKETDLQGTTIPLS